MLQSTRFTLLMLRSAEVAHPLRRSFSQLRALRQTSNGTVNVFLTHESNDNLVRIANTTDLCHSVRRLTFWGPLLEEDIFCSIWGPYSLENYTEDVSNSGRFDKKQLAEGFAAYKRLIQEQKSLLGEERALDTWASSISRLSQLEEVGFKYEAGNLDAQQAAYVKHIEDATLLEGQMSCTDSNTMEQHLGLVLKALSKAQVKLHSLDFGRRPEDRVNIEDEFLGENGQHHLSHENILAVFRPLRKLRLGLWTEAYHMMEWATEDTREVCRAPVLASILQEMSNLADIELVSSNEEADSPVLKDLLTITLPNLQYLALEGFTLSGTDFVSFIKRHSKLQSLELNNIALEGGEWREVFEALRSLSRLEIIRFEQLNKWFRDDKAYLQSEASYAELEEFVLEKGSWTENLSTYFDRPGLTEFRKRD